MDEENKKDTQAEEVQAEVSAEEKPAEQAEEKKAEKAEPAEAKKEVAVPAKFKDIVEKIEQMSVLELNELVKLFEEKFGVSAQATVVAGGVAGGTEAGEAKDSFKVTLTSAGDQKVQVIKAIKEKLGLGLKDAKDLVDAAPSVLKEEAKKEEADEIQKAVEAAGGKVEVK